MLLGWKSRIDNSEEDRKIMRCNHYMSVVLHCLVGATQAGESDTFVGNKKKAFMGNVDERLDSTVLILKFVFS